MNTAATRIANSDIAAITFDLDDTLWPLGAVIQKAEIVYYEWLQQHCPAATAEHSIESLREKRLAMLTERPALANDVSEWRRMATRNLLAEYGADQSLAEAGFQLFLAARCRVAFYDEVVACLQQLAAHYRIGAITNGNADLAVIGADHLFASAQYATFELPAKPDPKIYLKTFEELGVAPEQVLHVGDNAYTDVEGARQLGCQTAWINRGDLVYPDDIAPADIDIATLDDLLFMLPQ